MLGPCLWLIPLTGTGQLICYFSSRYYANKLHDAKFIQELMQEDEDDEASDFGGSQSINADYQDDHRKTPKIERQDLDESFTSEHY